MNLRDVFMTLSSGLSCTIDLFKEAGETHFTGNLTIYKPPVYLPVKELCELFASDSEAFAGFFRNVMKDILGTGAFYMYADEYHEYDRYFVIRFSGHLDDDFPAGGPEDPYCGSENIERQILGTWKYVIKLDGKERT